MYNLLVEECRKLRLPKFEVADSAPETLVDVVAHYKISGRMKVWSGASEATIWTPSGNYMFRAWHDYVHVLTLGEFNRAGEAIVCLEQQRQVESSYLQRALEIEIMGQLGYQQVTGQFPIDQVKFFNDAMKGVL